MVLSKLTDRLPEGLRDRLPGGSAAAPSILTDVSIPTPDSGGDETDDEAEADGSDDRLSLVLSLVTLAGLALAMVGAVARLVVDRMGRDGATDEDADTDVESAVDTPDSTVDIPAAADEVGDTETAVDVSDEEMAPDEREVTETGADEADQDDAPEVEAGSTEDGDDGDDGDDEATEGEDTVVESMEPDIEVTSGRTPLAGAEPAEPSAPPRIAPFVGMVALVGIRLLVKKLGGDPAEA